ncbi:AMP-binding enzyme [Apiospora hydei]|uniref:AMP-binding enzyme n=1 Tax=Apiospora hydei TaxID=1337664 RepID=A0ABR1VWG1_9PEZI
MPIPLGVAIPAAVAGLAYLNAKTAFWYDMSLVRGFLPAAIKNTWREHYDRANNFYKLEDRAQTKSSANRIFLMYEDRTWTYAQSYDMALRYGNWLQKKYDIKAGDIVAMDMMNSDHFVLLTFGLWSIGAKPAYINYNLTGKPLTHCVKAAGTTLMLVEPDVADKVDDDIRGELKDLRIELLTPELMTEIEQTEPTRPPDELRQGQLARDMAILIYTSGTTGLPKAAVVAWGKLTMAGTIAAGFINMKPGDIFYTCMPIYHSSATIMGYSAILEAGATFAIGRKFSTKTYWKEARKFNATMVQYVGETCRYLLAAPPQLDPVTGENLDKKHRVRVAFGNGLRPDVWEKFRDRFGIDTVSEFYGATEGFFATWNSTRNPYAAGAIGRNGWLFALVMKTRLAVIDVDPDTDLPVRDPKTGLGRSARRGAVGELMFVMPDDSADRFQGYYKNKKATDSKVVRNILRKDDRWFRTGDLVSWDGEGRMYFHDRIGDTYRWKSENVATTEVAQAMGAHPAVVEANVYGVQLPHHDGRAGCAALALQPEVYTGAAAEKQQELMKGLAEHARNSLPKYAVPIFLRVVTDMTAQTTGTNKQQKHGLRVQGVDPEKVGGDELWWLRDGAYVKFGQKDWNELNGGRVKL